jgi:hypothetical protein
MNAQIAQQIDLSSPFLKRKHHVAPYIFLAKFLVPDWEDKVNSGIGVVVPARQATEAGGPVRQPYAEVKNIHQSETMNLATDHTRCTMVYYINMYRKNF